MQHCVKRIDPDTTKDFSATECQEPVSHQGRPDSSETILREPQIQYIACFIHFLLLLKAQYIVKPQQSTTVCSAQFVAVYQVWC